MPPTSDGDEVRTIGCSLKKLVPDPSHLHKIRDAIAVTHLPPRPVAFVWRDTHLSSRPVRVKLIDDGDAAILPSNQTYFMHIDSKVSCALGFGAESESSESDGEETSFPSKKARVE